MKPRVLYSFVFLPSGVLGAPLILHGIVQLRLVLAAAEVLLELVGRRELHLAQLTVTQLPFLL